MCFRQCLLFAVRRILVRRLVVRRQNKSRWRLLWNVGNDAIGNAAEGTIYIAVNIIGDEPNASVSTGEVCSNTVVAGETVAVLPIRGAVFQSFTYRLAGIHVADGWGIQGNCYGCHAPIEPEPPVVLSVGPYRLADHQRIAQTILD